MAKKQASKKMAKKTSKQTAKKTPKQGTKKTKPSKKASSDKNIIFELKLIVFFLLSVALAMSVHGFPMGIVGEAVRYVLSGLFSVSMYFIPYFLMAWILVYSLGKFRASKARYLFALLSLFLAQTIFVGFYTRAYAVPLSFSLDDISLVYTNGSNLIGAGLFGNLIFMPIYTLLGYVGTILIIIALCFVFLLLASSFTFSGMMALLGSSIKKTGEKAIEGGKKIGESVSVEKMKSHEDLDEEYDHDYANYSAIKSVIEKGKNNDGEKINLDEVELLEELGGFGEFDYEKALEQERQEVIQPAEEFDELSEKQSSFKFIDIPVSDEQVKEKVSDEIVSLDVDNREEKEELESGDNLHTDIESSEDKPSDDTETKLAVLKETDEEVIESNAEEEQNTDTELDSSKAEIIDEDYVLPSLDILMKGVSGSNAESELDLVNKAAILEETFKSFKVDAEVTSATQGPMITRFEVKPKAGVKISKIASLSDDIAMRLAATNVRILAPIPGKSAVGIEVPNETVSVVRLRDVLESKAYDKNESKIKFGLGKDISGEEIVADLAKMPHLLIAGATGSGKSVCVNTIISSILFNAKPSEVKFLMIDPKVVELSVYNGIPHLLLPVVTDPTKASVALNWAVSEMTQRYAKFAEYRVRDINSYNEKYAEWKRERDAWIKEQEELQKVEEDIKEHGILEEDYEENLQNKEPRDPEEERVVYKVKDEEYQEKTMEFMPRIVIIIDELADLMVVAGKQIEEYIARLAQMARAAGMHLIVATQRPSVDVITGLIKANIPSRIAFAVSSQIDSRTILDEQGADKLLGKGDMLFLNAGKSKPTRVQGAFVTDNEVEALVTYVKDQFSGELEYDESVVDASKMQQMASLNDEDRDELLDAAIEFVIKSEKASTSMIQRKFRIGYNRAARMIEEMEERGIVGESRGAKPREVLITMALWESGQNDK